jgi:hypothetical protein
MANGPINEGDPTIFELSVADWNAMNWEQRMAWQHTFFKIFGPEAQTQAAVLATLSGFEVNPPPETPAELFRAFKEKRGKPEFGVLPIIQAMAG